AYVPRPQAGGPSPGLIVTVHGSDYAHEPMCRFFAGLGRETNSVVLAPLFGPASGPRADPDGYKGLRSVHADYDRALMEMVDEVGTRFGAQTERFCLFGFSGGAQFAHRFLYVYPQRLRAVSIAAPGMVTLIHAGQHLWVGTQNLRQEFGRELSLEQIRRVKTQLLVGSTDDAPHFGAAGEAAYNFAGRNRVERLESLAHNYRANGISCETHIVAGAGHDFVPLAEAAVPFLRREMQGTS
ncbi:MAG: alpha/beta hydrolase, partial [Proteobacteria bacterium]|nr:alpha/beta hydrolase [Pseudomonadota bacterium]